MRKQTSWPNMPRPISGRTPDHGRGVEAGMEEEEKGGAKGKGSGDGESGEVE